MLPEILLHGKSKSGKDTVAEMMCQYHGAVSLAMADPMKRFAAWAFGFDEETLWGPSEKRNAMDPRFTPGDTNEHAGFPAMSYLGAAWHHAGHRIATRECAEWIAEILGRRPDFTVVVAQKKLVNWFNDVLVPLGMKEKGLSARAMLQTLGTEWGRSIDENMWIRYAQRIQRQLLSGGLKYDRTRGPVTAHGQKYDLAVVTDGRFRNEALGFKAGGATTIRVIDPNQTGTLQAGVKGHASEAEQDTIPDHWFDVVLYNDKRLGLDRLRSLVRGMMVDPGGLCYTRQVW